MLKFLHICDIFVEIRDLCFVLYFNHEDSASVLVCACYDKTCDRPKDKYTRDWASTEPLDGVWAPRLQDLMSPQVKSSAILCLFAGQDPAQTQYE